MEKRNKIESGESKKRKHEDESEEELTEKSNTTRSTRKAHSNPQNKSKKSTEKQSRKNIKHALMDHIGSSETGLIFPVSSASKALKKGQYTMRVNGTAPVYLTAVLQYITTEVLDLANKLSTSSELKDNEGSHTITPAHIEYVLNRDKDLNSVVHLIAKDVEHALNEDLVDDEDSETDNDSDIDNDQIDDQIDDMIILNHNTESPSNSEDDSHDSK